MPEAALPRVRLGLVVSYYNPSGSAALRAQTELCALKAAASQGKNQWVDLSVEVLVSDGSGLEDTDLRQRLSAHNISYMASSIPLGFAQGYNQGLRYFSDGAIPPPLLATCANDVFCDLETLPLLGAALVVYPNIGCAMPYLTQSDYLTQNDWVSKHYRQASSMTLNLNVFRTADLVELDFIPEAFSGYYNDLALMIELKRRGKIVVLINGGNVVHLGQTTTSTSSMARAEQDRETFRRLYPAESQPGASAIKQETLAAGRFNRLWFYLQSRGPAGWRRFLTETSRLGLQAGRYWANLRGQDQNAT